jgi:autocrine motility factor receptor
MILLINRLPIPSLKQYCLASFTLLSIVVIYGNKLLHEITTDNSTVNNNNTLINNTDILASLKPNILEDFDYQYLKENGHWWTAYKVVTKEPWCVWVLINFCYCCLILFGKFVQKIIFGKLRALENQRIKDQFWNYIFLKFIFIFGVLNLEDLNEVIMWCVWFSIIGFLSIHCQICKDRFEYVSLLIFIPSIN